MNVHRYRDIPIRLLHRRNQKRSWTFLLHNARSCSAWLSVCRRLRDLGSGNAFEEYCFFEPRVVGLGDVKLLNIEVGILLNSMDCLPYLVKLTAMTHKDRLFMKSFVKYFMVGSRTGDNVLYKLVLEPTNECWYASISNKLKARFVGAEVHNIRVSVLRN